MNATRACILNRCLSTASIGIVLLLSACAPQAVDQQRPPDRAQERSEDGVDRELREDWRYAYYRAEVHLRYIEARDAELRQQQRLREQEEWRRTMTRAESTRSGGGPVERLSPSPANPQAPAAGTPPGP